ncbi:Cytochrome P450 [Sesbania bispinosa]|nr:Cytochrome P450 [Sesbania bispinosa]
MAYYWPFAPLQGSTTYTQNSRNMADKHGPIFYDNTWFIQSSSMSSWEMAKECFTVHDKAFSTRPCVASSKLLAYNYAMFGFAPYGPYWREMRKLATIELLSNHRLELLKNIRISELEAAIRELTSYGQVKGSNTMGLVMIMQKVKQEDLDISGYEKAMKRTASELDTLAEGWLEEHKRKRALSDNGKEEQDFMDVMLNVMQDAEISGYDSDTIIKATCLNLILAGSDTTVDRKVEESDIKNLVYLQAIVKETLRLYPATPIITFRAAMDDCTFSCGYHIPAGTHLMVNAWKIHRDGRVWPDPHDFKPERFLTSHKDVDVRGQNFELVPFGSGRRACPGASLALKVLPLTLATLLHSFNVSSPSNQVVDMTESFGLTNLKATPLDVVLTPRLDTKLYEN